MHAPVGSGRTFGGQPPRRFSHQSRVSTVQKVYCRICRKPFAKPPEYRRDICIRCLRAGEERRIHAPVGSQLNRASDCGGRRITRGGW